MPEPECFNYYCLLGFGCIWKKSSYSSFTAHGATFGNNHGYHGAPSYPKPAPSKPTPVPTSPMPTPTIVPASPAHPVADSKPAAAYPHETPKHNCTVQDVTESTEVCTPALETSCKTVELPIVDKEFCYISTRTVCTESIEEIEICTYNYQKKYEDTTSKTVEITFKKETKIQMVTVCQPGYGHGYQAYGHQYCKEVSQETAYNVPVVTPVDAPVMVSYSELMKTCGHKTISLPRVSCSDIQEEKCITVPQIEELFKAVEKCSTMLGAPSCQQIELSLPKQVCIELVYGYAHDTKEVETYA
nr:LOW QUALITY PROTEIN: uncharacterized protein LOC121123581 [Lepeophtheirus salmonis]